MSNPMPNNKTIREEFEKDVVDYFWDKWNDNETLTKTHKLSIKHIEKVLSFIEKTLLTQLQEIEDMVEGMDKVDRGECPECGGDGFTAEHDPEDPHENGCSSCPIQVQCEPCQGTGTYEMPDLRYNQALKDIAQALKKKKEELTASL